MNNKRSKTKIIDLPRYYLFALIFWLSIGSIFELDVKNKS